jgi:beta-glucosidase/6-phospho-beta-glucosidase/beta-galactosidase
LIEKAAGKYDWSSWLPALEAAQEAGVEVIWDLFHYGMPDHVDAGSDDFPRRFADFAAAAVEMLQSSSKEFPLVCPLNEINFASWAVEIGYFTGLGPTELGMFKRQLVRAAIAAAKAIRSFCPNATLVSAEPLVHVAPRSHRRADIRLAKADRVGQFEAYDWILGRAEPELGGDPSLVDVIGVNFYPHNQWYGDDGATIPMGHHEYRPLADMLVEARERYGKPLLLTETGAEGSAKPSWLHYVCSEVREAITRGVAVEGICWYPITAYPGWDNSRHAEAGLLSTVTADGSRHVDQKLLEEFEVQRDLFAQSAPVPQLHFAT